MPRLDKIFKEIQLIRNTVTVSHHKYIVSGAEALIMDLAQKEGIKLLYIKDRTHPNDLSNLCDSIALTVKKMLSNEDLHPSKTHILQDIQRTVIKIKFILNEQI